MQPFSVKAELEQGGDKPLFYAVLGVCVDVSVFKGGKADSLAKKYYSSPDVLDRRNGHKTGIVFGDEMCYIL